MTPLSKIAVFLAVLTLGQVDASPFRPSIRSPPSNTTLPSSTSAVPDSDSSSTAAPILGSAPLSCLRNLEPEEGTVCNAEGDIINLTNSLFLPFKTILTKKACADECAKHKDYYIPCTSYSFMERGYCQLYGGDFSERGFSTSSTKLYWYQMECWNCENRAVLDVDFEDYESGDALDWTIGVDDSNGFQLGVQTVDSVSDTSGKSKALVVSEQTSEHVAGRIDYLPMFDLLESRPYKLVFTAKTTYEGDEPFDWGRLNLFLWNSNKILFQSQPTNRVDLGGGWSRFTLKFTIEEGQEGQVGLTMWFWTSQQSVDWYFDDFYVQDRYY
ncbi:Fc.00g031460.m01.CDS01 [Cosmosporella sp. VM-42]